MKTLSRSLGLLISTIAAVLNLSAEAAVIKGVQTGTVTMGSLTQSVTITSVDPLKAFVICQESASNGSQASDRVNCQLNSATTLTVTIGVADAAVAVRWHVVEFRSGVSVQRGLVSTATFAAGVATVNVTLGTAVNLAKAFPLTTATTATTSRSVDEEVTPTTELTTSTNLRLTRNQSGNPIAVAWQVVQIESASVQKGFLNMPQGNLTVTGTLSPPVDTARTFLVFTANGGASVNGVESRYRTTGVLTNSTTLTFTRAVNGGGGNDVDIAWFAVRMTDGTTVQRGSNTTASAATTTMNAAISAIVTNRSVPFISMRGDAARTSNNDFDDTSWAAALTSATNLQMTKSATASMASNATVAWEVVQFASTPNLIDGDGREVFP